MGCEPGVFAVMMTIAVMGRIGRRARWEPLAIILDASCMGSSSVTWAGEEATSVPVGRRRGGSRLGGR